MQTNVQPAESQGWLVWVRIIRRGIVEFVIGVSLLGGLWSMWRVVGSCDKRELYIIDPDIYSYQGVDILMGVYEICTALCHTLL